MRSIKRTIVISLTLAIVVASIAAVAIALMVIRHRLIDNFDAHLRLKAEAVASLLEMDDGELELDERDQALGEFQNHRQASYFEVRTIDEKTIERSLSLNGKLPIALPGETAFVTEKIALPDGRSGRVGLLPIVPGGPDEDDDPRPARDAGEDEPPLAWIIVAAGTEDVQAALVDIAWVLAIAAGLLSAGIIIATPRLVSHGLKPLKQLSDRAARLDADNLAERFPSESLPVELSPIAHHLNASLDRISTAFDRERRFAASAAHELRTPLAAIRANAEVATKWPDPQRAQSALGHISSSAQRMQSLIERLLEMARLGNESPISTSDRIDLVAVLQTSLDAARPTLIARQLTATHPTQDAFMARSDVHLLQSMIDNLIGNAAFHADASSEIRIAIDPHRRLLTIANRSSELTQEDMAHLFEPLWTRSTDRSQHNAGLGLALVTEYARLLGVSIKPTLTPEGWFQQELTFPA